MESKLKEICNTKCSSFRYLDEKDLFYCASTGKVVEKEMKCLINLSD